MRRQLGVAAGGVLLSTLCACGGSAAPAGTTSPAIPTATTTTTITTLVTAPVTTTTTTTTTAPEAAVEVVLDVPYHDDLGEDWLPPLLDVYSPAGAEGLPVVVIIHGASGGVLKRSLQYPELAGAIATGGAVVFVPTWGTRTMPSSLLTRGASSAEVIEVQRQVRDEVACAVAYAVSHAVEYGGDPTRLVLLGHSGGANEAGLIALTQTSPSPGCAVSPTTWALSGVLLWDGDWLLGNPEFDVWEADLPGLLAVMTPWPSLATAPEVPQTRFVVSTNSRRQLRTPNASETAEWLSWRDPTGQMSQALETIGAFADGYVDIGEEAEVMVEAMKAHGMTASLIELTDPGTSHERLAPADFAIMVDQALLLTRS